MIGKRKEEEDQLFKDAEAVEGSGAFSVVLEYVTSDIAKRITEKLSIPTICIGSGPYCDGQVLVLHDILGLSTFTPPFAKQYVNLSSIAKEAIMKYAKEVREGQFPSPQYYV